MAALQQATMAGSNELARKVLEYGASPFSVSSHGEPVLHHAIKFGSAAIVDMLLRNAAADGPDVLSSLINLPDADGWRPADFNSHTTAKVRCLLSAAVASSTGDGDDWSYADDHGCAVAADEPSSARPAAPDLLNKRLGGSEPAELFVDPVTVCCLLCNGKL